MPNNQKDRLGDKLRNVEKAREDQYFAERDRELVGELKEKGEAEQEARLRTATSMRCPKCGTKLQEKMFYGVKVDDCSGCGGIWLDKGEFEALADRKNEGWLGRFLNARTS